MGCGGWGILFECAVVVCSCSIFLKSEVVCWFLFFVFFFPFFSFPPPFFVVLFHPIVSKVSYLFYKGERERERESYTAKGKGRGGSGVGGYYVDSFGSRDRQHLVGGIT
ncbi:hypothetical protein F4809DRAFT_595397 [Biscogniauxia mediterranea]|nr:hypothetical protein F4809DRAFT_595397 [Biscogniauxia mediterranea]